jgi:hypothetical protein
MAMQVKRRIGTAGAPPTLDEGQFGYNDTDGSVLVGADSLYIGSTDDPGGADTPVVKTLVSATRQVELAGAQTITGAKTIAVANLHITGGANNNILTTDGSGNLSFTAAPSGGLTTVSTDGVTIDGDGATNPLEVISIPEHDITIQTRAAQPDGSITTINITPAAFDATGDGIMTNFAITRLDDGTY